MIMHALLIIIGTALGTAVGVIGEAVLRSLIYTYEPPLSERELAEIASCK